jgi:hypothetical protein
MSANGVGTLLDKVTKRSFANGSKTTAVTPARQER